MPSPSPIVICQQFHPCINYLINDIMLQMWVCLIHYIATRFCSSQWKKNQTSPNCPIVVLVEKIGNIIDTANSQNKQKKLTIPIGPLGPLASQDGDGGVDTPWKHRQRHQILRGPTTALAQPGRIINRLIDPCEDLYSRSDLDKKNTAIFILHCHFCGAVCFDI